MASEDSLKNAAAESSFDALSDSLPEGTDPFDDQVILDLFKRLRESGRAKRQKMARDWFRSELFYNGIQWINFDQKSRRWRPAALNRKIPQPVTNIYAAFSDVFASLLSAIPLEVTYRPTNDAGQFNQGVVNTVNDLVDAIQQTVRFEDQRRRAAPMASRQGEFFICPSLTYDESSLGAESAVDEAMPGGLLPSSLGRSEDHTLLGLAGQTASPAGPEAQLPGVSNGLGGLSPDILQQATDFASGLGEMREEFPGVPRLHLDVFPTFECYMDESADDLEDSLWFINDRAHEVAKLKRLFKEIADQIKPVNRVSGDISRYYSGSFSQLTSGEFGSGGFFSSAVDTSRKNRANVGRLWVDPCPNYPQGLYAIIINDDLVARKGPLQFKDPKTKVHFKNIVHFRTKRRVGSIHGRSPMDDVIAKQIQRNRLESFIELIIYRMASPHWLKPDGCGIDEISGEPGLTYTYNKVVVGQGVVLKPEQIPGIPPAPTILRWMDKLDADIELILGVTKVLLGQLPPGTPAAKALEILLDRARARHGDVFYEWNSRWSDAIDMLLKIVRQTKPVQLFKTVKRPYGGYDVRIFLDQEFDQDIEIIPETEQPAPPRSTAAEIGLLKELTEGGLFQAPPPLQYAIAKKFGMEYLLKSLDSDKEYIAREHYLLTHEGVVPVVQTFDTHPMHVEDHRVFSQSEEFLEWKKLNPQKAQQFLEHISAHQFAVAQAQAMAQGSAMAQPPRAGAGQPVPGQGGRPSEGPPPPPSA